MRIFFILIFLVSTWTVEVAKLTPNTHFLQSGNTYCANIWEKKDSQIIIFYRYYVFALFESHIKQDIKWNGSIHQAPPAATCGKTNLNKLIEFLKLTGN